MVVVVLRVLLILLKLLQPVSKVVIEACGQSGNSYAEHTARSFSCPFTNCIVYTDRDLNTSSRKLGATEFIGTVDARSQRGSTAPAYLTPEGLARTNPTVIANIRAQRIASEHGHAETDIHPRWVLSSLPFPRPPGMVYARRKRLGPTTALKQPGTPVVKDLPHVGRDLSDEHIHVVYPVPEPCSTFASPSQTLAPCRITVGWHDSSLGVTSDFIVALQNSSPDTESHLLRLTGPPHKAGRRHLAQLLQTPPARRARAHVVAPHPYRSSPRPPARSSARMTLPYRMRTVQTRRPPFAHRDRVGRGDLTRVWVQEAPARV
ncbi:hypothetical protein CERSUDRAFT_115456 [Gelatoporia subvermispora B]|uniref:Uncharacterized protein n=1 Tax=Ceriporiopsis subvermispora (strain B) TaxID=914234 RepID=M2PJR5_CERS8|nr:hypothetical protein CERSUDRAFT_115456 [Gelatoporia subvermispora B]